MGITIVRQPLDGGDVLGDVDMIDDPDEIGLVVLHGLSAAVHRDEVASIKEADDDDDRGQVHGTIVNFVLLNGHTGADGKSREVNGRVDVSSHCNILSKNTNSIFLMT